MNLLGNIFHTTIQASELFSNQVLLSIGPKCILNLDMVQKVKFSSETTFLDHDHSKIFLNLQNRCRLENFQQLPHLKVIFDGEQHPKNIWFHGC